MPPRRWSPVAVAALAVLLSLAVLAGCSRHSPLVRKNPLVRALFYPPAVDQGEGLGEDTPGARFDHSAYGALLAAVVDESGRVDYGALAERQGELDAYLGELAAADLGALSRHSRLALLVNAYNAFTWKLILEHPGVGSIRDIPAGKRWKARRWRLGGETVSLDELEHERIRRAYGEPRVHFALVCAAEGCPPLAREPYTGERLAGQLDAQARAFFARPQAGLKK